ncbi:unnamed protein product [Trifolium pratense]|uniref:Uncharacterized protein n=1 Tax=Trifolium pratense TaxID=57577 RepID=A0ACB0JGT1_TRIPR|nr:unnamed protein product [Trifolium pratense]
MSAVASPRGNLQLTVVNLGSGGIQQFFPFGLMVMLATISYYYTHIAWELNCKYLLVNVLSTH